MTINTVTTMVRQYLRIASVTNTACALSFAGSGSMAPIFRSARLVYASVGVRRLCLGILQDDSGHVNAAAFDAVPDGRHVLHAGLGAGDECDPPTVGAGRTRQHALQGRSKILLAGIGTDHVIGRQGGQCGDRPIELAAVRTASAGLRRRDAVEHPEIAHDALVARWSGPHTAQGAAVSDERRDEQTECQPGDRVDGAITAEAYGRRTLDDRALRDRR